MQAAREQEHVQRMQGQTYQPAGLNQAYVWAGESDAGAGLEEAAGMRQLNDARQGQGQFCSASRVKTRWPMRMHAQAEVWWSRQRKGSSV